MTSTIFEQISSRTAPLAVIGLGYVGLPIAAEFAKFVDVIGFDTNQEKINLYRSGVDPTNEIGDTAVSQTSVAFTSDPSQLRKAKFHIVAVPTPINQDKTPNLDPVEQAARLVGKNLSKGAIVVFESTVYPGVTEDVCIPILEEESGFQHGRDFHVGYSPERINPGDKVNTLSSIVKIVAGANEQSLEQISSIYELVVKAGVHRVSNIRTAEAIKVVENSQRDINIAFMNELALAFDRMGIDTNEVVDGMNTKWNSLGFRPGLVGGHCIGVDPYYFTYEAERLGYHSQIILSGRQINDSIGGYVADTAIKMLVRAGKAPSASKVYIFGLTFKENCPDVRNSKVADIIDQLRDYDVEPIVVDPWADSAEAKEAYGVRLSTLEDVSDADCIIMAVGHDRFVELSTQQLKSFYGAQTQTVLVDVKGILTPAEAAIVADFTWRL